MNNPVDQPPVILMADDDQDDCLLLRDALDQVGGPYDLRWVGDGEELMHYLGRTGEFAQPETAPWPDLILLDLRMPRKDGRETLHELKTHPRWRRIPVIVLTTSTAEDDIRYAYEQGVNSYITKPSTFRALVDSVGLLSRYWFGLVHKPPAE
jgi:CheY-like chemotaxis protein